MQIYFDFSGYSDMAVGASRLFGQPFDQVMRALFARVLDHAFKRVQPFLGFDGVRIRDQQGVG